MTDTQITVQPTDWQSAPATERHRVSHLGHIMPKIFVLVAEVFALPADTDRAVVVESLSTGLAFALSQFPALLGALEIDEANGVMWVTRKRENAATLYVKHHAASEFPSFDELDKKDFPASLITGHALLPETVTAKQLFSPLGHNNEDGLRVAAFQINFIEGGFVLGLAIHHAVSDGPGCDGFLTTWAQSSASAKLGASGSPPSKIPPFTVAGSPLDAAAPDAKNMAALLEAYPVLRDAGGPMLAPPPDFQMPTFTQQMWHFPQSKLQQLKDAASAGNQGGDDGNGWISTYDAVMAVLWGSITRARIDMYKPPAEAEAILVHAFDTRRTWSPPLPERFLGVGAAPARVKPVPVRDIAVPESLPRLAQALRASIREMTPQYVTGMLHWVAGHADRRWIETAVNSFLGMDLGASSWQGMSAYTRHDFGFGLPRALRWPSPMFDGFVFLYPSRAAIKGTAADEGIELCVCLEATCQERLLTDKVLRQYATPRGKFGKQIQKRQLEVPEYAASFVNYKALKKLIKRLSATPTLSAQTDPRSPATPIDSQAALQANRATFFFQLERELEKVNAFYLQKEAELKVRLKTLLDKKRVLRSRGDVVSRRSAKFTTLQEGFQQFANDLNKLQQFVEINGTAFSKILKKWDKTSKSKTKELYLSRAVEVQPFFNATVISELSDQATTSLQELGALAEGDHEIRLDGRTQQADHIVSSQHLLGTDEGDADTLLLDAVLAGHLDSLRDLLGRILSAAAHTAGADDASGDASGTSSSAVDGGNSALDVALRDRITRTFLASVNEGSRDALQVLIDTGVVDAQSEDDINERNCLHQATIYGNNFVLEYGLAQGVSVVRTDVYGRVPLHYASMHGRLDMLDVLLAAGPEAIDRIDHDNFTPLIHAIIHGHLDCVNRLLEKSARLDPISDADHVPLNLACEHGSDAIVELLLKHGARILPDAEGLYPQHLVARSGRGPSLLLLLQQYGADLNQVDKLYGWTPIMHAAGEGNVPCLQALLNAGVDPNILDEKGLPAMYYAAWEGHLECMKLLTPYSSGNGSRSSRQNRDTGENSSGLGPTSDTGGLNGLGANTMGSSTAPEPMALDPDAIPVLELPPPIIPLRRYGHNFLDTKAVVQISFEDQNGEQPLLFFHDGKYPAARLTISSKVADLIPKNIMLPFQEDTRLVFFQVDHLDSFVLDFDVFPTYGAKVIAKTVALPSTFRTTPGSSGSSCCLPLFDPRLRAIGQLSFHTQVIKPFPGKPLEIADFETYWKATSQLDGHPSMFVAGSSLSGEYVRLYVQNTKDGVPVLWPTWTVSCGNGGRNSEGTSLIDMPVACLSYEQFRSATASAPGRSHVEALPSAPLDSVAHVHQVLATAGVALRDALALLPSGMHVNLQVLFPGAEEERQLGLGGAGSVDLNTGVDAILGVVFDHARAQRAAHAAQPHRHAVGVVRSVVFSSYNPQLCTAINWKQPNFPVFLCNDLGREHDVPAAVPRGIWSSGRRTASIKEVVRTAQSNNFMGLMCTSRLLDMVPALVAAIKSQGLALVVDKSAEQQTAEDGTVATAAVTSMVDPFPRLPEGVDGVLRSDGVLRFIESIDM